MVPLRLEIEPELVGPVSVGTVVVVKLLARHLGLSLQEALAVVNRCVFERECAELSAPSREAARALQGEISRLPPVPRVRLTVVPEPGSREIDVKA